MKVNELNKIAMVKGISSQIREFYMFIKSFKYRVYSLISILLFVFFSTEAYSQTGPVSGVKSYGPNPSTAMYEETVVDLEVKALGRTISVERHWANGRWVFNPQWTDLAMIQKSENARVSADRGYRLVRVGSVRGASVALSSTPPPPPASPRLTYKDGKGLIVGVGSQTSIKASDFSGLRRNGDAFGNGFTQISGVKKRVFSKQFSSETIEIILDELSEETWTDSEGNVLPDRAKEFIWRDGQGEWIKYDTSLQAVSFGNVNAAVYHIQRDSANRISSIIDHFGTPLITFIYDDFGLPETLTDYTGRSVNYTWEELPGRHLVVLSKVTDVRGNDWQYAYHGNYNGGVMIAGKVDPEGRSILIERSSGQNSNSKCASGTGGRWLEDEGGKWSFEYSSCTSYSAPSKRAEQSGAIIDEVGVLESYGYFYDSATESYQISNVIAGKGHVSTSYNLDGDITSVYLNNKLMQEKSISPDKRTVVTTNLHGYKTTRKYDSRKRLIEILYADKTQEKWTYNEFGKKSSYTNEKGVLTEYEYDNRGNLTKIVEAVGKPEERTTEYQYDEYGRVILERQVGDSVTQDSILRRTSYDNYGNPLTEIDAEGNTTHYTYDALGNILTFRDGEQGLWQYSYDESGNLTSETTPLLNRTQYTYDKVGNLTSIVDALGRTIERRTYNARNQLVSLTDAYQAGWFYEFNDQGLLTTVQSPEGAKTSIEYDGFGRATKYTSVLGDVVSYFYDKNGAGLYDPSRISGAGYEIEFYYDKFNRPIKIKRGYEELSYKYDEVGNLISNRKNLNKSEIYTFDSLDRVSSHTTANNSTTLYSYDDRDNLLSITNDGNLVREFKYNRNNLVVEEIWPAEQSFSWEYDSNGDHILFADAKGQVKKNVYDSDRRLLRYDYFNNVNEEVPAKSVSFTYNKVGSMTGYNDGSVSVDIGYDHMQRVEVQAINYGPFQKSHNYRYNKNGQKIELITPDSSEVAYTYDQIGRLKAAKFGNLNTFTIEGYKGNVPNAVTFPGGSNQKVSFDELYKIKSIIVKDPAKNDLFIRNHEIDQYGRIVKKTSRNNEAQIQYDLDDQVLSSEGTGFAREEFNYDSIGNRITSINPNKSWLYDTNFRLTKSGNDSFVYDENGSLIQRIVDGSEQNYIYDLDNRLVEVRDDQNVQIASYTYDPFGRRLSKTVDGISTYFYYSDEGLVSEFDEQGNQVRSYGYFPGSEWSTNPVYTNIQGQEYFYVNDHIGTPHKLIDKSGAIVWSAEYETFGIASVDDSSTVTQLLRFPGQYYDDETGFHYNWQRYYYPTIGRYIGDDPIGMAGGINSYTYALNNPIANIDPNGEWAWQAYQLYVFTKCMVDCNDKSHWTNMACEVGDALGAGSGTGARMAFCAGKCALEAMNPFKKAKKLQELAEKKKKQKELRKRKLEKEKKKKRKRKDQRDSRRRKK